MTEKWLELTRPGMPGQALYTTVPARLTGHFGRVFSICSGSLSACSCWEGPLILVVLRGKECLT